MGALTKKERDALDDVFLSIYSTNKYAKFKTISFLLIRKSLIVNSKKLLKQAKYGLKETKKSQYLLIFSKKKKNLSK